MIVNAIRATSLGAASSGLKPLYYRPRSERSGVQTDLQDQTSSSQYYLLCRNSKKCSVTTPAQNFMGPSPAQRLVSNLTVHCEEFVKPLLHNSSLQYPTSGIAGNEPLSRPRGPSNVQSKDCCKAPRSGHKTAAGITSSHGEADETPSLLPSTTQPTASRGMSYCHAPTGR
jgi:hypothetical protein